MNVTIEFRFEFLWSRGIQSRWLKFAFKCVQLPFGKRRDATRRSTTPWGNASDKKQNKTDLSVRFARGKSPLLSVVWFKGATGDLKCVIFRSNINVLISIYLFRQGCKGISQFVIFHEDRPTKHQLDVEEFSSLFAIPM